MNISAKIFLKEKSSGLKSSLGSSAQKVTLSYLEEIPIKINSSSKGTWRQEIFTCIQITEEPPQQLSKATEKISQSLSILWRRLPYSLFVDPKLGRQKLSLAHGGFTLNRFQSLRQLVSFCQLVLSWFEAREISFIQTECKWEWHYCIKSIMNLHKDISMIVEFMRKKTKSKMLKFQNSLQIQNKKNIKSLPSSVLTCRQEK